MEMQQLKTKLSFPLLFLVDDILITETDKNHIKFPERLVNALKNGTKE